ncbi:MAG: hypothetical protein GDA53_02095 [Rhodobacteraceae bacterium]|nr:hypothetical protein [Paracoccaceae bacterium]
MTATRFLPGLPAEAVEVELNASPGGEPASGKFDHPESSSALAVNTFGWFLQRPGCLPALPLPGFKQHWPALEVAIESEMRFPWSGGRHPWLDVGILTKTALIGVESKRYEPFRGKPKADFSKAYDRAVWGDRMDAYCRMRDRLREGTLQYQALDAAQLVKHAFGLRTQTAKGGRFRGTRPILVYLFAEPECWPDGRPVDPVRRTLHQDEITDFAQRVAGDEVAFHALDYAAVLDEWQRGHNRPLADHADLVKQTYRP